MTHQEIHNMWTARVAKLEAQRKHYCEIIASVEDDEVADQLGLDYDNAEYEIESINSALSLLERTTERGIQS